MSVTLASPRIASQIFSLLEKAILETLAYSDVFDYPLTLDELYRYLVISATKEEIKNCVANMNQVDFKDGYYFLFINQLNHVALSDNEGSLPQLSETLRLPKSGSLRVTNLVETRKSRELKSRKAFDRAMLYGKILGRFPFVRMVALTGSLAMLNLSTDMDMDYMLVTQPNRLWIARAFAVTFGRIMRLLGDRICINLLISENALHWKDHDLYSAREICQMIPISGFDTYRNFRVANLWTEEFLPNATMASIALPIDMERLAYPLHMLESLAMKIQLKIISKRTNPNDETNFTADICQGNFHQHKKWTQIEYEKRLKEYVIASE